MGINDKIVSKYIAGEDIVGYTFDELENNASFMIEVLKQSKDFRMEQFASSNVKKNPKFVIEVLKLCGKNISQMLSVSKTYLESVSDKEKETIDYKEIILYIDKYFMFEDEIKLEEPTELTEKYITNRNFILDEANEIFEKESKKATKDKKHMFKTIASNNSDSEIIKEYFARWYIYSIFHEEDKLIDENKILEETLRKNLKNLSIIDEMGVDKFIIFYIKKHDEELAEYLINHMEFLEELKSNVIRLNNKFQIEKGLKKSNDSTDSNLLGVLFENANEDFTEHEVSHLHSYEDVGLKPTSKNK